MTLAKSTVKHAWAFFAGEKPVLCFDVFKKKSLSWAVEILQLQMVCYKHFVDLYVIDIALA